MTEQEHSDPAADGSRTDLHARTLRLAREDQLRFAGALIDPPKPNARLLHAAERHAKLIKRR